jgi:dTDP-4-amino-4,6-dideoxygalactose transaminase
MLRHVAPAGAPITVRDLAAAAGTVLSFADAAEVLRQAIDSRFGVRYSFHTSTGRAGLTLLLRALRQLAARSRDEVVLPSYTCYSVAASVVKAGLRPRVVDIWPDTLDYAPGQLEKADFTRVLAVVATNLYGLPNDLPALSRLANQQGVFVIDDAAQSMGASVNGRPSGTCGDAGLFSFDRGKNVSAVEGGLIVTNSHDIAAAVERELAPLSSPRLAAAGLDVLKALAYSALLRPWLYGIPARIPQLQLGKTVFSTDFPLERPSWPLMALASIMMNRLGEFTEARCANAKGLDDRLRALPFLLRPQAASHSQPVYLRYPVLMPDRGTRDAAVAHLNRAGIGATASYPLALGDVPALRSRIVVSDEGITGGQFVAERILTLPTHPYVTSRDLDVAADALGRLLQLPPTSVLRPLADQSFGNIR